MAKGDFSDSLSVVEGASPAPTKIPQTIDDAESSTVWGMNAPDVRIG